MSRQKLALGLFALLLSSNSALAQVILSNYPPSNDTGTTADLTNLRWKALSFSVPAGPNIPVGDLTVRLGDFDVPADNPVFQIRDHTGSTTAPGTNVLFTWTTPAPAGLPIQDYTFGAGSFFELTGGTSYWLVAIGALGGNSDWRGSSPSITPTGIATYGGQSLFTANGGSTWSNSATINSFNMVVGVPEPTSLALAGVGVVGGWWLRRRRK